MRKYFSAAALIVALAVVPRAVAAQSSCGYFHTCGSLHFFDPLPKSSANAHDDCDDCEFEPTWPVCHPVCAISMTEPALNKRFQAVVAAAEAGDIRSVLNLASAVPGYVMWNAERQAVQIKACSQAALIASPAHDLSWPARAASARRSSP